MKDVEARVILNDETCPGYMKMHVEAPEIASTFRPGQFVMVRVSDSTDPLLRRPLGISRRVGSDSFEMIYKVVGRGTTFMAGLESGAVLRIAGPLGNGFEIEDADLHVLVAGGCGVPPLIALADMLEEKNKNALFLFGGASRDDLPCLDYVEEYKFDKRVYTEDGSYGKKGLVTGGLKNLLDKSVGVYACGPAGMLKAVSGAARKAGAACQVSLEERMACGIGACMGCAVKIKSPGREASYQRVCTEGPVFHSKGSRVIW